jgi:hypothetical protein
MTRDKPSTVLESILKGAKSTTSFTLTLDELKAFGREIVQQTLAQTRAQPPARAVVETGEDHPTQAVPSSLMSMKAVATYACCRYERVRQAAATCALPVASERPDAKGRTPRWSFTPEEVKRWVHQGCPTAPPEGQKIG